MNGKPVPLLQQLRGLIETHATVSGLRFMVDTADGLRFLPIDEVLKLAVKQETVVQEKTIVTRELDETALNEILKQLSAQETTLQEITAALGDVGLDFFEFKVQTLNEKSGKFSPDESVAVGLNALMDGACDRENVAVGMSAGVKLDGTGNVLLGTKVGFESEGELQDVTAIGHQSAIGNVSDLRNVTLLGAHTRATGNDQVILGDFRTTSFTHNAGHRRSDVRDMSDQKTIEIGLDFVMNISPIQYRNDFREAYFDWTSKPSEPPTPRPAPVPPDLELNDPNYQPLLIAYRSDKAVWEREVQQYEQDLIQYQTDLQNWMTGSRLARISSTGEHREQRLHYGFDSNQILRELQRLGIDAACALDHSEVGGEAVRTHSDAELVAILWRAVQQLTAHMRSPEFVDAIASALQHRHSEIAAAAQVVEPASPLLTDEG